MTTRPKQFIPYYRVSTDRQGKSGLGLEAQEACIRTKAQQETATILASYTEVESGTHSDRPELQKAMAHARRAKATLVIAKLDRLSRDATFLLTVRDSPADVLFCDLPEIPPGAAGKMMIGMWALLAEYEAGVISERTKAALAAYKARGGKLGTPANLTPAAIKKGQEAAKKLHQQAARTAYTDLEPVLLEQRAAGQSFRQIASYLNSQGYLTRNDKPWNHTQVKRVLGRLGMHA